VSDDSTIIDSISAEDAEEATQDLAQLSNFLRQFPKGSLIFDQDDDGRTMYFIQKGRVRIVKVTAKRSQPLAILEPGSFFGEMAVINEEPRTARAEAIDNCSLLEIDRSTLDEFLSSHPRVAQRMIRTLAERLKNTDALVERLLTGDPVIQVVEAILDSIEGSEEEPPEIRDVQTLMVKSATDPRLLRWVLGRMKHARFIRIEDRSILVTQKSRLEQYLNFLKLQQDLLTPK